MKPNGVASFAQSAEAVLVGLIQVKPEKEQTMPAFKEGDKVRVLEGQHAGECGEILGPTSTVPNEVIGTGGGVRVEIYRVQMDKTDLIESFAGVQLAPK